MSGLTVDPRVAPLLTADAVRRRCRILYVAALANRLEHFSLHLEKLEATADYVIKTIHLNYPSLDIPFHSRWRHFEAGGVDRWSKIAPPVALSMAGFGRAAFDLAIVSVLLDAGSGPKWRYHEVDTGLELSRSEGLAVASFDMFASGAFSSDPKNPLRCDARKLASITAKDIASGFQATPKRNPLEGLEGRAGLLRRLGETALAHPAVFDAGDGPRPGALFDLMASSLDQNGRIKAATILNQLLVHLGPIWPGRLSLFDVPLGDTWPHPMARTGGEGDGLVTFHKLSQWLAYSLIEPLQWAGITVSDLDGLTGLPEYRNGGLILDMGLIALKNPQAASENHHADSALVVEWRALTVILLDQIALKVRQKLGLTQEQLPLAKVLEGGTWSAGRRIAREKREGGGPPLTIISDGTVF